VRSLVGKLHGRLIFNRRVQVLAEAICALLPPNASVLDVGCGDGTIASLCLQLRPDIRIEGIDVFVRPETKIPVRVFDGRVLPFEARSWDVVMFVDVLHHTDDPDSLVREAARVARQAVVIKDHLADTPIDVSVLALMDWVGNAPHGVRLPYNYLSGARWASLFQDARLRTERTTSEVPLYNFPLSAVFGRKLHFVGRYAPAEYDKAA
jgi:SAM-dependent methyltransferase